MERYSVDGKSKGRCGRPVELCVAHCGERLLVIESCGLRSSSQGLKFVRWWGTASVKELMKKGEFLE